MILYSSQVIGQTAGDLPERRLLSRRASASRSSRTSHLQVTVASFSCRLCCCPVQCNFNTVTVM